MDSFEARFGGIQRLIGRDGARRLRDAHVCVVGIGGVGSWAVEALARSGVGGLTLVDLDDVCISNTNRQIHAVTGGFGKPKVDAMVERARAINPDVKAHALQSFFLESTADDLLETPFTMVLDAMDAVSKKCLLIVKCRERGLAVVTVGASGGRCDPTQVEVADLARTSHDPLLQEVRKTLRTDFHFPRGERDFGVDAVFSRESPVFPTKDGSVSGTRKEGTRLRLDCRTGFGTASFVTGTFGFVAAGVVVRKIAEDRCAKPAA
jgi:tRNA A37 threonylcarbamoyladenosine dehydratase